MSYNFAIATVLLAATAAVAAYPQVIAVPTTLAPGAYEHIFRHVAHLQSRDADIAAKNTPAANFSAYYKNLAKLTQAQADTLQTISHAALTDLAALDQQAQTVIVQWRAQALANRLPGQKFPAPPAQLATMQTQRTALLNSYRNQLQAALGPAAFSSFEQAVVSSRQAPPKVSTVH